MWRVDVLRLKPKLNVVWDALQYFCGSDPTLSDYFPLLCEKRNAFFGRQTPYMGTPSAAMRARGLYAANVPDSPHAWSMREFSKSMWSRTDLFYLC